MDQHDVTGSLDRGCPAMCKTNEYCTRQYTYRQAKDIYLSLLTIHSLSILGAVHLLQLRNKPVRSWKLFFWILFPLGRLYGYILAAFLIFIAFCKSTIRNGPRVAIRQLFNNLVNLLGKEPLNADQRDKLPTSVKEKLDLKDAPLLPTRDSWLQILGRILFIAILLAHSVVTWALSHTRRQSHVNSLVEDRAEQLAFANFFIGVASLLTIARFPMLARFADFPRPEDVVDKKQAKTNDRIRWFRSADQLSLESFSANGLMVGVIMYTFSDMRLSSPFREGGGARLESGGINWVLVGPVLCCCLLWLAFKRNALFAHSVFQASPTWKGIFTKAFALPFQLFSFYCLIIMTLSPWLVIGRVAWEYFEMFKQLEVLRSISPGTHHRLLCWDFQPETIVITILEVVMYRVGQSLGLI